MSDAGRSNLLIHEKSPYLLQHAHNPVDWQPWGDDAFRLAKERGVPVLISIGYATCHWCHVMERESFEDPELAKILNANFVAIKVDREERPDVDGVYMKAIQALGQQGGWPLNVFTTPEGVPFYGGTYFPPVKKFNRPSFSDVLKFLTKTWINEQEKVAKQGQVLITHIQNSSRDEVLSGPLDELSFEGEDKAVELYERHYDSLNYGFTFQPQNKFPPSMGLSLLLRHYNRTGSTVDLKMVEDTLRAMKNGGIYDQIGGGLSRYSTDYKWLVPHFEKMLYDNSLFALALIETFQVTQNQDYVDYANDLFQYIDRDMTSAEGAFFSAEDADSEGVEGKFYVWTQEEIETLLGRQTAGVAMPYYNVLPEGNFEGKTILNVTRSQKELAKELSLPESLVQEEITKAREMLLAVRSKRIRPLLDDKILTSWNGLMITAMARAGRVFGDSDRIVKAQKSLEFILKELRTPEGKLLRRYREGEARFDGYLCDYASLAVACLELYEAVYDPRYIQWAKELMDRVEEKFASEKGAYYETASDGEELIIRQISGYDGVEPAGNSAAAMAFIKLSVYLGSIDYLEKAEKIFCAFHEDLSEYGLNSSYMLQALHLYLGGIKEVVFIGKKDDSATEEILAQIRTGFFPNAIFAFAYADEVEKQDIPLLAGKTLIEDKPTLYVCQRGACLSPIHSIEELLLQLNYEDA